MAEMDQLLDESEYQHKFVEFSSANTQASLSWEKLGFSPASVVPPRLDISSRSGDAFLVKFTRIELRVC